MSLGAVRPHVRSAAEAIDARFSVGTMYGIGVRPSGTSDHPLGLAVDFMVGKSKGDAIAAYAVANASTLNIKYVIWNQRIHNLDSRGWRAMDDRGSSTANHKDHVHISFNATGASTVGSLLPDIDMPAIPGVEELEDVLTFATSADTWRRAGMVTGGLALILVASSMLGATTVANKALSKIGKGLR